MADSSVFSVIESCECLRTWPVTQMCPTPCYAMDYSPLGASVRGLVQAKILEWAAISFSTESS